MSPAKESTIIATRGDRSIIPNRGMTMRNGCRTGSVMSFRKRTIGWSGRMFGIQESSARTKIAMARTWKSIEMNVERKPAGIPLILSDCLPFAENCTTDPNDRRALLDRDLEVVGQAHRAVPARRVAQPRT